MSIEQVWAFKPLKELHYQTGFVACDAELARKLIEAGLAQDPGVGGLHLKEIEADTPHAAAVDTPQESQVPQQPHEPHVQQREGEHGYETTHLTPLPPKRRK